MACGLWGICVVRELFPIGENAICRKKCLQRNAACCIVAESRQSAPGKKQTHMKYTTSYTSSNGQPSNGHETHESLNSALTAWESNIRSLLHRSGGDSTLQAWEDADLDSEHAIPIGTISWIEHCEGGFITAEGDWSDQVSDLARSEEENGETLTANKLVRHLSE